VAKKKPKLTQTQKELNATAAWSRKVGRPRDDQQKKVYRFGQTVLGDSNRQDWTFEQAKSFVNYVWACYFGPNAQPLAVYDGRGRSCASASGEKIYLPRWARNRDIILHELGHAILSRKYRQRYNFHQEAHGPEFVRMHAELHGGFGHWPSVQIVKLAKAYGLRVARKDAVPKPLTDRTKKESETRERWLDRC